MKPKPEIIIINESVAASWLRDAGSAALVLGLMGAGVYLESTAMQCIGGIMALLWMVAKPTVKKMTYDIAGARKRLDEIEGAAK